jgi:glycosyltransferase involved in cell wall biosynthesis
LRPTRILALSNFYPPHHVGGYELGAADVLAQLMRRGHHVEVLTSTRGVERPQSSDGVHRWLELEYARNQSSKPRRVAYLAKRELASRRAFARACELVRPDLIYAFNLKHVSISMLFAAERRGFPVHFFVSDDWLAHWERDLWYRVRRGRRELELGRAQFVSEYLKRDALAAGKRVETASVIPWGIELDRYLERPPGPNRCRILFAGQLAAHKGVHTVVEAFAIVRERLADRAPRLSLAGRFLDAEYEARIRSTIARSGLENHVDFLGVLPRERLTQVLADHDVFAFASVWEEPFSIVLLEAMATGLGTVATATGGTPELVSDRENCLVFPKEDSRACAERIMELCTDSELYERVRRAGMRRVRERHQLATMVDAIEGALASPSARG